VPDASTSHPVLRSQDSGATSNPHWLFVSLDTLDALGNSGEKWAFFTLFPRAGFSPPLDDPRSQRNSKLALAFFRFATRETVIISDNP
jgi:hypothetical protein